MRSDKKVNTNVGVLVGLILQVIGRAFAHMSESGVMLGLIVSLIGTGFFVWGCMNYAEGKGHSKWLGLLGLLSCLGLIILVLLPDNYTSGRRRRRDQ